MTAKPSDVNPSPLICEWDEIRGDFPADGADGGGTALWATGTDVDGVKVMVVQEAQ